MVHAGVCAVRVSDAASAFRMSDSPIGRAEKDWAKVLGDATASSPISKMFGMRKRPTSPQEAPTLGPPAYAVFTDAEVLKMLKEKDAEIEALKAELAEERELVEVHKQEADALAAILAKRAARLAAKNGGEGPSSAAM